MAATGRPPGTAAANREFGSAANDAALAELQVAEVGLTRTVTPGEAVAPGSRLQRFRRTPNWLVVTEARINQLTALPACGARRDVAWTAPHLGRLPICAYNLQRITCDLRPAA
jgi:hypothetical protein